MVNDTTTEEKVEGVHVPSAVIRSRQEKRSKGAGLYKRGAEFMRYGITFA